MFRYFAFYVLKFTKHLNNLKPSFMKQTFELKETNGNVREKYWLNLDIPNYNQITFGRKS